MYCYSRRDEVINAATDIFDVVDRGQVSEFAAKCVEECKKFLSMGADEFPNLKPDDVGIFVTHDNLRLEITIDGVVLATVDDNGYTDDHIYFDSHVNIDISKHPLKFINTIKELVQEVESAFEGLLDYINKGAL